MRTPALILSLAAAPLALAACASKQDMAEGDPLAGVNRPVYDLNEALARNVVEPVTGSVDTEAEEGGRNATGEALHRAGHVLNNLGEPKNAINGALQANPETIAISLARFGLNSTIGLLGMYDVARKVGINERQEDFGQTLGSWGVDGGTYMVAPVVGPTNTRDAAGMVVDTMLNPLSLAPVPGAATAALSAGNTAKGAVESAETATATSGEEDPYAAQRQRYEQRRAAQIANADHEPRPAAPVEHRQDAPTSGEPLVIDIYETNEDR